MSETSVSTTYSLVMLGNISSGQINFSDIMDGWTDADALALQAVLETWTPPSGTSFQVVKTLVTSSTSAAGGSPAAFS